MKLNLRNIFYLIPDWPLWPVGAERACLLPLDRYKWHGVGPVGLSLVLSRQESAFSPLSSLLEHWGILSMDIYILSDIIKIPFRVILWNKLHLYTLSFVLCTVLAIVLSVWLSEHLIRKHGWLRFLILGVRKE